MRYPLPGCVALVGFLCLSILASGQTTHNDPVSTYERRQIQGFTVLISHRLTEHPAEVAAAVRELTSQLGRIAQVVPDRPLGDLRRVPIWLELAETEGLGEFHWGPEPLIERHRNPAKARAVEITNARHLVEWAPIQPWSVLHELAHAYHCRVLGENDPALTRAYDQAIKTGKYGQVATVQGGNRPAYAATSKAEYFAELSEAYFGKNDFEPFDRSSLRKYDPQGYRLMVDTWGSLAKTGPE